MDDRQEFLRQFLLYGHVLTPEEIEAAGDEGVPETPPSLNQYKEQVATYEKIFSEVESFKVKYYMSLSLDMYMCNLGTHSQGLGLLVCPALCS